MANDYVTLAELKGEFPDTDWGSTYDVALTTSIMRASRAIDIFTHRGDGEFYASADTARYFDGWGGLELWIGELAAVPTTVAVAEGGDVDGAGGTGGTYTTWAATDYLVYPRNALAKGRPILRLDIDINNGTKAYWYPYPKSVKVTGKFGYAAVPPEIVKKATAIQAMRYFKRAQQAYQDTGAIVELGQLTYTQKLDPDVAIMVEHLMRHVPEFS